MVKTVLNNNRPPPGWQKELPNVSFQSDVMWILWKDAAGDSAGDLK